MATAAIPVEATPLPAAPAARPPLGLIRLVADAPALLQHQQECRAAIMSLLQAGRDYDTIPGTNKPSLLKPGAEAVTLAFGCFARYRVVESEIDHDRPVVFEKKKKIWRNQFQGDRAFTEEVTRGESVGLYRYVIECEIVHRDSGAVIGSCLGVASTMESKYIDRPRDCENTIAKMGEKRAHVGAVLNAFGLSEQFTQDVEDNPELYAKAPAAEAPADAAPATESAGGAPPATPKPRARPTPADDVPACPKCAGPMWDNRPTKRNPNAPDFRCKNRSCDAVIWPTRLTPTGGRESGNGPGVSETPTGGSGEAGAKATTRSPAGTSQGTAIAGDKRPEDMTYNRRRLGDYTTDELLAIIRERRESNPGLVSACETVIVGRGGDAGDADEPDDDPDPADFRVSPEDDGLPF